MEKKCKCVSCPECGGSGTVWWSFSGKYIGRGRCDDLDNLAPCDLCRGTGYTQMCDECLSQYDTGDWI